MIVGAAAAAAVVAVVVVVVILLEYYLTFKKHGIKNWRWEKSRSGFRLRGLTDVATRNDTDPLTLTVKVAGNPSILM